jgi:hypothetical protein
MLPTPGTTVTTGAVRDPDARVAGTEAVRSVPARAVERRLMSALAVVGTAATVLSLLPGALRGPAVMNGSGRGTALVMLVVGLPLLVTSGIAARRGSLRAELVRTGATAYLLYNAVLLVFGTPFNRLFLLYVVLLGLAVWTLADATVHVWQRTAGPPIAVPRWAAGYLAVVVVLNALAWLARVVPAVATGHPADLLDGTGLPTNPVIAQDLAFWLPVMGWLAIGAWRGDAPRVALAAAGAVFWVVEGLGVAVDQWWGHAADPGSPVVSAAAVPMFLVLAAVGLLPARALLRAADPGGRALRAAWPPHLPPPAVVLGVLAGLNALAALAGAWGLASGMLTLGATAESRLPGASPVLAAVALTVAVAVPNAVVAVLALRGDPRTGVAAETAGVVLVLWILVELAFIHELSFFHPLYVAIGLLMVRLGRGRGSTRS